MRARILRSASIGVVALAAACATSAYYQGNDRLARGDNAGAVAKLTQAIQEDPTNFGAYLNRGLAYERLEQYDRALSDYSEAIRIVPTFAAAYHNRGHIHANRDELELAIRDYDEALRCSGAVVIDAQGVIVPSNIPGMHYDRGNALYWLGRYQEAIDSYDRALALEPDFADAANNRRIASSKLGGR